MSSQQSIWYRLGYALERTRQAPAKGARKLATLKERRPDGEPKRPALPTPSEWPSADQLVASGLVALVAKTLDVWRPRRKAGIRGLLKAGLAGAAAALALEVVRPLLHGRTEVPELSEDTLNRMLTGAGQGLVYGAVLEPRLPGPSILKGTLYGSAEFAMDPMGGVAKLLGPHAPLKRLPLLGHLLEDLNPDERDYVEHLAFGVALAVIYEAGRSSNGILDDDGEA